ncbi:MAG: ATP-binding protein [Candidatus Auribacterota bacterium]|jgi:two-component system phosphate regulon sensor histidine kinase PhoR|uniref:histidine kinase n=1 Tax=Candidatus Auribacter fodinae TaxID=2093366 RepID=A0A3A4QX21_9BACT|nr:MAG: PAS domain-containing protein [Candidatus Auribacter fodinae]
MKKQKVLQSLLIPYLILIVSIVIILIIWQARTFSSFQLDLAQQNLIDRAHLIKEVVKSYFIAGKQADMNDEIKNITRYFDTRITVILPSGEVLADSEHDPATMENHGDRPEIKKAFLGNTGISIRSSSTLKKTFTYTTSPVIIDNKVVAVVRTSLPLNLIDKNISVVIRKFMTAGLVMAVLAGAASFILVRRLTYTLDELQQGAQRFASGDLHFRLPVLKSSEMNTLAESLNQMAAQLDDRIHTIIEQKNQLDAILSSMIEGVIAVDTDERILSINRAASLTFKVKEHQYASKSIQELIRNSHLHMLIHSVLQHNTPVEETIVLLNGEEKYLKAHGMLLRDAKGNTIGAVVVFHDITRLRKLENVRQEFVANVSHELKTPVTSIKGFVETLMDGAVNDKEDAHRFLEKIKNHTNRLNSIIDDLLQLAKVERQSEAEEIELKKGLLASTIKSAITFCEVKAKIKNISFEFIDKSEHEISANFPLIEQAVINLLSNAIKYSNPASKIFIRLYEQNNHQVIAVEDFGCGIAAEHLPRLFERFYRVDPARSRKLGGTGLGLAIVKHIVQAHNGHVNVDSAVGKGSVFYIHLPMKQ